MKKTHVDPWVYPDIFWELKALSDKTFEIQRRMLKSKQRRIWNPSKGGFEIQAKKDLKSKQRRIWNPSKEGFEIQAKKYFEIQIIICGQPKWSTLVVNLSGQPLKSKEGC